MIQEQNELIDLCNDLRKCPALAIDTEFVRTQTYWPILSIVQISDGKKEYIIDFRGPQVKGDPLNPDPLISLLLDLNITKIVHSCRQDFEIFMREWNILPQNIFDTQVASSLLYPEEEIGLARLLKNVLDVDLSKAQQNTDWLRRPLSPQQFSYALSDVEHLHDLWDCLANKLEILNRSGWLWEDQIILQVPETYQVDADSIWKKVRLGKSVSSATPRTLLFLKYICRWRENKAQSLNLNRGRIITDEVALALALSPSESLDNFAHNWPHLKKEYLLEIWDVIQFANHIPRQEWPALKKGPLLSGHQSVLLGKVREKQAVVSEKLNIAPRVLSNSDELKKFSLGNHDVSFLKGWRKEEFGKHCLKL